MTDQTPLNADAFSRRAAIYIRQAVLDDEKLGNALSTCRRLAAQANCIIVGEYKDIGVSGNTPAASRVGLAQVLTLAEQQQIDTIISPGIHHLGRRGELLQDLIEHLTAVNVQTIFS